MPCFPQCLEEDVFASTVRNQDSPVQKIFNSHIFSQWFHDDVQRNSNGPRCASLSAAKHRFASFAKPLGRMLLHVESFFRTLHRVASLREDAAWARTWLSNISSKKLLLLALAADGADTLMQLCRFLDNETCDPAALNQEICFFLSELDVQFRYGKVWEIDGYSKHVLGVLQRGQLYAMVAGQGKQIMVSEEAKREALQEFQVWLELCECTAKAEFPDFEVLNSMCVFNLAEDLSRRGEAPNDSSHCLRRVAQALKLEPFLLKAEWEKLRPIAAAQKKNGSLDNREAWKAAYEHTQKTSDLRKKYGLECLPAALQAYMCCSPSSQPESGLVEFDLILFHPHIHHHSRITSASYLLLVFMATQVGCGAKLLEGRPLLS